MGCIREQIVIVGMRKNIKVLALFDSGAYRNYIKRELDDGESPDDIGFHIYEGKHDAIMANGEIAAGERVRFKGVHVKGCNVNEPSFVILDQLSEYVIIGAELMQELGITLDLPNEKICIL